MPEFREGPDHGASRLTTTLVFSRVIGFRSSQITGTQLLQDVLNVNRNGLLRDEELFRNVSIPV
jgi:hypothetical protein